MAGAVPEGWTAGAAFGLHAGSRLDPVAGGDPVQTWRHLSGLIARNPQDLEAHVRRVMLACQAPMTDRAMGALSDVFLALGPHGQALRRRLLAQAEPWLALEDHDFLRRHLVSGLAPDAALPIGVVAQLDRAVLGQAQLVTRERAGRAVETLLQQAVAMIDEGDLDAARSLLEAGLLANPDDADVLRELLGVYHHARDTLAKAGMQARLLASHGRLPAGWS